MSQDLLPLFHVLFPDQKTMGFTLLRFQEHYESPKFAGKVFDHETFIDWYIRDGTTFTYADDWTGFNLPASALRAFREGRFGKLWRKEQRFLDLCQGIGDEAYIIATVDGQDENLSHELVHGLYHLFPDYAATVDCRIMHHDTRAFYAHLELIGYAEQVFEDETNAYHLTGLDEGMLESSVPELVDELEQVFVAHFGFSLSTPDGLASLLARVQTLHFPR